MQAIYTNKKEKAQTGLEQSFLHQTLSAMSQVSFKGKLCCPEERKGEERMVLSHPLSDIIQRPSHSASVYLESLCPHILSLPCLHPLVMKESVPLLG